MAEFSWVYVETPELRYAVDVAAYSVDAISRTSPLAFRLAGYPGRTPHSGMG